MPYVAKAKGSITTDSLGASTSERDLGAHHHQSTGNGNHKPNKLSSGGGDRSRSSLDVGGSSGGGGGPFNIIGTGNRGVGRLHQHHLHRFNDPYRCPVHMTGRSSGIGGGELEDYTMELIQRKFFFAKLLF